MRNEVDGLHFAVGIFNLPACGFIVCNFNGAIHKILQVGCKITSIGLRFKLGGHFPVLLTGIVKLYLSGAVIHSNGESKGCRNIHVGVGFVETGIGAVNPVAENGIGNFNAVAMAGDFVNIACRLVNR
ncbi:hypothetical protein D3C85_1089430 [compost metagenome]